MVGVAEYSGLLGGLIRKLVAISTPVTLTYFEFTNMAQVAAV